MRVLPAFVLLLSPLAAHAAPTATLAENGRALMPVVVSEKASDGTKLVAAELADYLGRIAGAKFEVTTGDGSKGVVLGTLGEFPDPALTAPLAIRSTYDGREAFAIRTEAARVRLIGATDLGASHAAFRLLEALGCRWFFPATAWEVVPAAKTLAVSLDETDRPRVLARRIWYGYGTFRDPGERGSRAHDDYLAWGRHNRMAGSFKVQAGHAWQAIIGANRAAFAEHPEYLALTKGQRQGPQLCVSNPGVRQLAVEWGLAHFAKNPDAEMVSMECSDGYGHCECEACLKLGTVSDRVFGLANEVARAVRAKHPGKMVGCLAYSNHSEPPAAALEPNVYVQLTAGFTRGRYTFDQLVELWPQKCKTLGFYEYFSVWPWDFDRLPGGKAANLTHFQSQLRRYLAAGATSFDAESGNNWGVHGRGYYVANRLLWDPAADVPAVLADFYDKAFGPAAPAMKRYYERVAPDDRPLMSRGLIGEALRDVEEATKLAKNRPDVLARIDQLKHYLRYVHLRWLFDHDPDKAKQKEHALAALALCYRTRYEYMNHWAAIRNGWADDLAKKYDEPTWSAAGEPKRVRPWAASAAVVSREETDRWFAEGLDYFRPTPVTEVTSSSDLVPVRFAGDKPAAVKQSYQGPAQFALFSNGTPITLDVTAGVIVGYRDRAEATYALTDAKGKIVAEGTVKLDGTVHPLALKVPAAGTYFFDFRDNGSGWRLGVAAGTPAVQLPDRGRRSAHLGQMQEAFFYVPKGTTELQFFWGGGPLKVLGPDRKLVQEVKARDEVAKVAVPAGADGKVWSFAPHAHGHLWFFNAPNALAASPGALLLPKELVAKDGLPVP